MVNVGRKKASFYIFLLTLAQYFQGQHGYTVNAPHIVLIVADDLGWNDVSWNNPDIKTPNLERLALGGVILNQSYVQPLCTPSRTAFMTGYFPYHVGRQNTYIHHLQPSGVFLNYTFLPEKLKQLGYSTHIIGKWHLGYCNWSYTPTFRGFDSFFGYYLGSEDYYTHETHSSVLNSIKNRVLNEQLFLDFRNNTKPAKGYGGIYSTQVFSKAATELISKLNPRIPTFLYLPFQAVHSPLEVPQRYQDMYKNIKDVNRRKYSGMVTALDEAIGNITAALKKFGFYGNSIIAFTTDNGGQVYAGGNNWPLRGNKDTLWEGGTRGPAFVHSPLLKRTGFITNNLFHAVDWLPTLLHVAGGQADSGIDGIDQWNMINGDVTAIRNEFIYNIYDTYTLRTRGAIRVGDYKLIIGSGGSPSGWYPPPTVNCTNLSNYTIYQQNPLKDQIYLFNIRDDPTEHHNLATSSPHIVAKLRRHLLQLKATMIPADDPPDDPKGNPKLWNNIFSPGWCKAKGTKRF